jgi:hypothetical protein
VIKALALLQPVIQKLTEGDPETVEPVKSLFVDEFT